MKKLILVFIAAIATFTTVSAQQLGWSYGVKAGANLATFVGDDVNESTKMRPGLVIGAFAENRMSEYFGLSAELLYSQQGAKYKISESGMTTTVTEKLDYLNIPILANLYVAKGLALKAGIQPAIKLNSEIDTKVKYGGESATVDRDLNGVNSFDLAIPIGLSYQFDFGLLVDFRYNISATKFPKNSAEARNSVLQLTAGWRF